MESSPPVIISGDHGLPIPVFRALEEVGPAHLIQIDAHLDWCDDYNGTREGYASPIRKAVEMDHIHQIF